MDRGVRAVRRERQSIDILVDDAGVQLREWIVDLDGRRVAFELSMGRLIRRPAGWPRRRAKRMMSARA